MQFIKRPIVPGHRHFPDLSVALCVLVGLAGLLLGARMLLITVPDTSVTLTGTPDLDMRLLTCVWVVVAITLCSGPLRHLRRLSAAITVLGLATSGLLYAHAWQARHEAEVCANAFTCQDREGLVVLLYSSIIAWLVMVVGLVLLALWRLEASGPAQD